jgi:hypothetical protein
MLVAVVGVGVCVRWLIGRDRCGLWHVLGVWPEELLAVCDVLDVVQVVVRRLREVPLSNPPHLV